MTVILLGHPAQFGGQCAFGRSEGQPAAKNYEVTAMKGHPPDRIRALNRAYTSRHVDNNSTRSISPHTAPRNRDFELPKLCPDAISRTPSKPLPPSRNGIITAPPMHRFRAFACAYRARHSALHILSRASQRTVRPTTNRAQNSGELSSPAWTPEDPVVVELQPTAVADDFLGQIPLRKILLRATPNPCPSFRSSNLASFAPGKLT